MSLRAVNIFSLFKVKIPGGLYLKIFRDYNENITRLYALKITPNKSK